jgi:hypothetical protein
MPGRTFSATKTATVVTIHRIKKAVTECEFNPSGFILKIYFANRCMRLKDENMPSKSTSKSVPAKSTSKSVPAKSASKSVPAKAASKSVPAKAISPAAKAVKVSQKIAVKSAVAAPTKSKKATGGAVGKTKSATPSPALPEIGVSPDEIKLRAYYISERRETMGWPGNSSTDWIEAETQLLKEAKKRLKQVL